jgi:ABC-type multidrug transport system ATPase subunit
MDPAKVSAGLGMRDIQLAAPNGRVLIQPSSVMIGPGVTSLIGANGAGKSTLLRALASLHPLAGGSAVLNGIDIQRDPRAFLEQAVYLPQNFATYPELTGRDFSSIPAPSRRSQAGSADGGGLVAGRGGLRAASKSKTGAYSQGMRQRLGFAYAMQLEVALYLLDEPFAGVDPESRIA